jgi:hypothetical protein
MLKSLTRSIPFTNKGSFGSASSKSRCAISRIATTASKMDRGLVVTDQQNIWARFVCYWQINYVFCKKMLSFWAFTRRQSSICCMKISRSGKSISNRFLIFWTMIKNAKMFDSQLSSLSSSSQSRDVSLRTYIYRGWNIDSLRQSANLPVNDCGYCKANSCTTIDRSEKVMI